MDSFEQVATLFLVANHILLLAKCLWLIIKRKVWGRRWWVDPILKERSSLSAYKTVFLKYKRHHSERFFDLTRLTVAQFDELLDLVKGDLRKHSIRKSLTPQFRLAFTVCYLVSGTSPANLAHYWKIGRSTAYVVIKETCEAIWNALKVTHLSQPSTEEWKTIADGYWNRWNIPNCCGAVDGKHIRIQCPFNSGSQFYNYKSFYSLVLMAGCDSNYCFTWVEVGDYGSLPDSSVFQACQLGKAMADGSLNFPEPAPLPETAINVPYYIVGDEAFPLRRDLMRPYARNNLRGDSQRIFNYRLSCARLTIENAFGILASRWRVLRTSMGFFPENVERVVLATVCLHNFIMKREEHVEGFRRYCPPTYADQVDENGDIQPGEWRRDPAAANFRDIGRVGPNRAGEDAVNQRDLLADYFMSEEGAVEWQWRSAFRGFEAVNVLE